MKHCGKDMIENEHGMLCEICGKKIKYVKKESLKKKKEYKGESDE